jgi:hypothetical protein
VLAETEPWRLEIITWSSVLPPSYTCQILSRRSLVTVARYRICPGIAIGVALHRAVHCSAAVSKSKRGG